MSVELRPGTRIRGGTVGAGLVVFGRGELGPDGITPLWLDEVALARCNAAALAEAALWLDEAEFERMYAVVMGAVGPRYLRTVTIPQQGRLPDARWSAPGWREPARAVADDEAAALRTVAALLGDDAPPAELEPAGGRQL